MVLTSWWTAPYVSTSNSRGTRTEPVRAQTPRSLRTRSTIIRFSARSFSLAASSARRQWSRVASRPRGLVPLIGLDSATPSGVTDRNRSGEQLSTDSSAKRSKAPYGTGFAALSDRYAVHGSSSAWTSIMLVRQTS
jgi:hypothetical protein